MVLKKRLDYGFNGYKEPLVPRASRSTRVRRLVGKRIQDDTLCAFDLLATVAGKLLQENERSHTTHCPPSKKTYFPGVKDEVRQEEPFKEKLCKLEPCDQGSCNESAFGLHIYPHSLNPHSHSQDAYSRMPSSSLKSYNDDGLKVSSIEESVSDHLHKPKNESLGSPEEVQNRVEKLNGISFDLCCSEDIMQVDAKPPPLVSSDSSVELLSFRRNISYPNFSDGKKEISRDDDEKSSVFTPSSSILVETFMSAGHGDRRIKKVSASNILKIKNTVLKDVEVSKTDTERQPIFYRRKTCYTRQRSLRCSPFKKKKIIDRGSVINPDGGVLKSPKVQNPGDSTQVMIPKDIVMSPSMDDRELASEMSDSCVNLRIKSFKVPEFFIEIPETATIGSLKRTVTEAVTSILGGILQVGVLLRGKKLKDDSKTLFQTGIHQHGKLDSVSFMLETNRKYPKTLHTKTTPQPPCDVTKQLTRYTSVPRDQGNSTSLHDSALTVSSNCTGGTHVLVPSRSDTSMEVSEPDTRALVPICEEALTVIPLDQNPRQSEIVQRRIRRPFSVAEVEALVQAVEKLGTGRWRDVKLYAFDNAKHRTYVDLKDKWKTLVHTAKISPQQRRGEPVPQELLDRVLLAHSYWSQQQAKHQIKYQAETCHLL